MIYEYYCTSCQNEWEVEQKITEETIKICNKCEKFTAKKLISKSTFILNGGGWAKEGYSNK